MTTQSCWRVAIHVYRRDIAGNVHVVERHGPVIQAPTPHEAIKRAQAIFEGNIDFASVGVATFLHTGHREVFVSSTELRPAQAPEIDLTEQLVRMAKVIRRRRGH